MGGGGAGGVGEECTGRSSRVQFHDDHPGNREQEKDL